MWDLALFGLHSMSCLHSHGTTNYCGPIFISLSHCEIFKMAIPCKDSISYFHVLDIPCYHVRNYDLRLGIYYWRSRRVCFSGKMLEKDQWTITKIIVLQVLHFKNSSNVLFLNFCLPEMLLTMRENVLPRSSQTPTSTWACTWRTTGRHL